MSTSLRAVFAGDRGRLLAGLLAAEFGTAVQVTAAATVLPLASRDLHGAALFGAASGGPAIASLVLVVLAPGIGARLGPRPTYAWATLAEIAGIVLAALAPSMALVVAGRLVQGAASGLFAAFGLSAIGGLYEDAIRPRVLGLFAVMWLLPSLVGPVVNAVVASAFGWRWAMAWPALLLVVARLVVGRRADLLPRSRSGARPPLLRCLLVIGGLGLAAAAPSVLALPWAAAVFVAGLALAAGASVGVLRALSAGRRIGVVLLFGLLGIVFFGGESVLSLGLIDVAGVGVAGASIAYGAGGIGWSLLGIRTPSGVLRDRAGPIATVGIAVGALVLTAATLAGLTGATALVVAVAAWTAAGVGMGIGYPVLSAAAFDDAGDADIARLAAAVAFTEFAGAAIASLLGGGTYSLTGSALPAAQAVGAGWVAVAVVAVATAVVTLLDARRRPPRPRGVPSAE